LPRRSAFADEKILRAILLARANATPPIPKGHRVVTNFMMVLPVAGQDGGIA